MKIAISSTGRDMESPLDPRFGRARQFVLFDPDRGTFDILDNQVNLNAAQGAGIQAAQQVVNAGCAVLISGHCGPKAFKVLSAAGVRIYTSTAPSVLEAVALFQAGKLEESRNSDVEGHWL
jgi:predicted Fe-Mo cluster-binding NifX family protein